MKRLQHIVAALSLVIGTSGCAGLAPVGNFIAGGSISSQLPVATMSTAKKLLTTFEDADTTTGAILKAGAKTGLLHGQAALTAKDYYDRAGAALDKAEAAKRVLDAPGIIAAINEGSPLLTQANVLAKGQ